MAKRLPYGMHNPPGDRRGKSKQLFMREPGEGWVHVGVLGSGGELGRITNQGNTEIVLGQRVLTEAGEMSLGETGSDTGLVTRVRFSVELMVKWMTDAEIEALPEQ